MLGDVSPNTVDPGSEAGSVPCATFVIGLEPAAMAAALPIVNKAATAIATDPKRTNVRIRASLKTIDIPPQ